MIARRVGVVFGVGLTFVVAALVAVLSEKAPRLAGTNSVRVAEYIAVVPRGGVICQEGEYLPGDAAAIRVFTGTYGGRGALRIAVVANGTRVRTGAAQGFRSGWLAIPISRVARPITKVTVCVRNRSSSRLALAGLRSSPEVAAELGGRDVPGRLGIEYLRGGRESWWGLAATIARRAGDASATFLGRTTLWLAIVLIAISALAALAAVLRSIRQ